MNIKPNFQLLSSRFTNIGISVISVSGIHCDIAGHCGMGFRSLGNRSRLPNDIEHLSLVGACVPGPKTFEGHPNGPQFPTLQPHTRWVSLRE